MSKIEFSYNRKKLIKLLLPALELLEETKILESHKEALEYKISQTPVEHDNDLKEVPPEPVLEEIKKKERSPIFKFIVNLDTNIVIIGMTISVILALSSLISCAFYEGVAKLVLIILSCVFAASLIFFVVTGIVQKSFGKISERDKNKNLENKWAESIYKQKVKEREEIISQNKSTKRLNAIWAKKREYYYSNVDNWKNEVEETKAKLTLNYECINETLDFLPERHRTYDSVSRLLDILYENRAENLKDALNLMEDILHKERVLKLEQDRFTEMENQRIDEQRRREEEEERIAPPSYKSAETGSKVIVVSESNEQDKDEERKRRWRNSAMSKCWGCKLKELCHSSPFTCNGPIEK